MTMIRLLAFSKAIHNAICLLVFSHCSEAWVSYSKNLAVKSSPFQLFSTSGAITNNNIVLRPSAEESSFDSYKIGGARVHRYSRDEDPDSETEYVMWYHGRCKKMAEDPMLPPLSTGRIGRATSRNGLAWVKDEVGSASEDRPDVSLGLNKESWWGFDTAHVGLGNVLLPMSNPAVLTEGGIYLMYFMGGSLEETPIADYMESGKQLPETMKEKKIQGMKMKVGVAVSQDGKTWGRVEGDDPSGAIIFPWDKTDPNQSADMVPAGGMDEELYCGWPEVVTNLEEGADESSRFRMFYSTMTKLEKKKCIAYATSPDGFRWSKMGIILRPNEADGSLDAGGCARCCVVKDAQYDEEKRSWSELQSWTMYYEGVDPKDNKHRILVARSDDGVKWNKAGLALDVGANEDAWDFGGVGSPHVVRMDEGVLRMYYTGQGSDGSTNIGVARLSGGESSEWVREQATISFAEVAE